MNVCGFNIFSADGDAHLYMLVELIDFFISLCSSVAYHTINTTIYKSQVIVWCLVYQFALKKQSTLYLNMDVNGELRTPAILP